ncbi:uncharacterized protein LOC143200037 isoform X1 [Rhynchophorus ferrugineus]|uniref:uncharacterized protein LOC143200037 isoform X1 n=2 Tax=Rhynchophorus ferrugineus TaxID=354439 RepID=UPI003FCD578A
MVAKNNTWKMCCVFIFITGTIILTISYCDRGMLTYQILVSNLAKDNITVYQAQVPLLNFTYQTQAKTLKNLTYSYNTNLSQVTTIGTNQTLFSETVNGDGINYLVNSAKCKIIDMGVFSPDALKYYKILKYKPCSTKSLLTRVIKKNNVATVVVDSSSADTPTVSCCYSNVYREKSEKSPDNSIKVTDCKDFQNNVTFTSSAIMIKCKRKSSKERVYENVHAAILIDDNIKKKMTDWNETTRPLSILFVGIDSISRLNFARSLPQTYKYVEERGWISLKGYNKMDDNTFPNLMAILTGYNQTMSYKICNPKASGFLDKCPMLWYNYRNFGYITAYAEDEASISTFNYKKKGFVMPPTDYYFRPYIMATEKLAKVTLNGMTYCTGPETAGERILNLAEEFAITFKDHPHFGFFWMNSYSHNNLNSPSMMDEKVKKLLTELEDNDVYNNTLVVFLSDHGIRFGDIRLTPTGWQEERLPFIYLSFPLWFKEKYPIYFQNFQRNVNKLTTPYDLHMTLQHILVLGGFNYTIRPSDACPQCMSLFEEIPHERACEEAGIIDHWCTCEGYIEYQVEANILQKLTTFFLDQLGKFIGSIDKEKKCDTYKIKSASTRISQRFFNKTRNHILLRITTKPVAEFETTITYYGDISVNSTLTIGDISRLDYYSSHSHCVADEYLKKYCYCK